MEISDLGYLYELVHGKLDDKYIGKIGRVRSACWVENVISFSTLRNSVSNNSRMDGRYFSMGPLSPPVHKSFLYFYLFFCIMDFLLDFHIF